MSLCFFTFIVPTFDIADFLPLVGLPSFSFTLPSLALSAPVCLADEF